MKARKTDNIPKRLVAWAPAHIHAEAKARSSMEHKFLGAWILEAVEEKLRRGPSKK